jgi:hypothetical protein
LSFYLFCHFFVIRLEYLKLDELQVDSNRLALFLLMFLGNVV